MHTHPSLFAWLTTLTMSLPLALGCDVEQPAEVKAGDETEGVEAMNVAERSASERMVHGKGHRGHHGERKFRAFDKDGDGRIVLSDVPEHKRKWLAKADENGDGAVTKAELEVAREARRKAMDTDGDGTVSKVERKAAHQARHEERLKQMDADGDGTVSDQERAAARTKRIDRKFQHVDTNGDGAINATEAGERWKYLAKADADGNGTVTRQEFETAMAAKQGRGHRGKGKRGRGRHGEGKHGPRGPGQQSKDAPAPE